MIDALRRKRWDLKYINAAKCTCVHRSVCLLHYFPLSALQLVHHMREKQKKMLCESEQRELSGCSLVNTARVLSSGAEQPQRCDFYVREFSMWLKSLPARLENCKKKGNNRERIILKCISIWDLWRFYLLTVPPLSASPWPSIHQAR